MTGTRSVASGMDERGGAAQRPSPGGRKAAWMALAALLAALLAAGCTGFELDNQIAFGRVESRGYPVAEVPGGVILAQSFTLACALEPGPPVGPPMPPPPWIGTVPRIDPPIVGAAGSTLHLDVTAIGCPVSPDKVRCNWEIRTAEPSFVTVAPGVAAEAVQVVASGQVELEGGAGTVPLSLPAETGIYRLRLACRPTDPASPATVAASSAEQRAELDHPLYATLGPPLAGVSPPAAGWYERGAYWGRGFLPTAGEHLVLRFFLDQLWQFGRRHWQYGSFPGKGGTTAVCPPGAGDNPWCFCPGGALLVGGQCNFGSCFEFSEAFDVATAAFGIGGFLSLTLSGDDRTGLLTPPGSVSIDPRFPSNVACNQQQPCFPYLFGTHSLRRRDGLIYDATFNRVYTSVEEPVARSLVSFDLRQSAWMVDGTPGLVCRLPPAERYGGWSYFAYPRQGPTCAPIGATTPAGELPGERVVQDEPLVRVVSAAFSGFDDNDDELFERLQVELELVSDTGVEAEVAGLLFSERGRVLASSTGWNAANLPATVFRLVPGKTSISIFFDGDELFRSAFTGLLAFRGAVRLRDRPQPIPTGLFTSEDPFASPQFGSSGTRVLEFSTTAVDRDNDAIVDALRLVVPLAVRGKTPILTVQGRLSRDGRTLGYTSTGDTVAAPQPAGSDIQMFRAELDFPLELVAAQPDSGTLEATVEVFTRQFGFPYRADSRIQVVQPEAVQVVQPVEGGLKNPSSIPEQEREPFRGEPRSASGVRPKNDVFSVEGGLKNPPENT